MVQDFAKQITTPNTEKSMNNEISINSVK